MIGIRHDLAEDLDGLVGGGVGAVVGSFEAVGAGVFQGKLELGVLVSPAPEGFGINADGGGNFAPAAALEGELNGSGLVVGEAELGVDFGLGARKCPIMPENARFFGDFFGHLGWRSCRYRERGGGRGDVERRFGSIGHGDLGGRVAGC